MYFYTPPLVDLRGEYGFESNIIFISAIPATVPLFPENKLHFYSSDLLCSERQLRNISSIIRATPPRMEIPPKTRACSQKTRR
jgi:hypothetical protein